jgi:uncharacterized protein (DUF1800 family)
MDSQIAHALIRFGLGRRGTETLPLDPHIWLRAQLDQPDPLLGKAGPNTRDGFITIIHQDDPGRDKIQPRIPTIGKLFDTDRDAAFQHAIATDRPFRERLVLFWANHFTVSARIGGRVGALLGAYMQEAIRPFVSERFESMLRAVIGHPAMLYYLSNEQSIGPNSQAGRQGHGGINENLARECLELHTVGIGSGYTQADVISLAGILTGWGVEKNEPSPGFVFRPEQHEPGDKVVMGKTFPEGQAGGEAVLHFLANHPATYRRLATKLVQHFVADTPSAEDVAHIASVLSDTGGDLRAAALAVTNLSSAWQPLTKFRAPVDYEISVYRALDLPDTLAAPPAHQPVPTSLYLGEYFWFAPLPNGWPDTAADWVAGEALLRRADWVWELAGNPAAPSADDVAARTLGNLLSADTRARLANASSRREALALLLSSPEFMRR